MSKNVAYQNRWHFPSNLWLAPGWTIQTRKQVRPRAQQNMGWFKLTAINKKLPTIVKSAESLAKEDLGSQKLLWAKVTKFGQKCKLCFKDEIQPNQTKPQNRYLCVKWVNSRLIQKPQRFFLKQIKFATEYQKRQSDRGSKTGVLPITQHGWFSLTACHQATQGKQEPVLTKPFVPVAICRK